MEINSWQVLFQKNFLDISSLIELPSRQEKLTKYNENGSIIEEDNKNFNDNVVNYCDSRYNYPKYKEIFYVCKNKLEGILGEKLYPTYYYDRFYYNNSFLNRHIDRPSCEISVSVNISSNLDYDWPLFFEINKEIHGVPTKPGDAIIYKGMEVPHWRQSLIGKKELYYHQIFFHFVRANGHFLEYAFDRIT